MWPSTHRDGDHAPIASRGREATVLTPWNHFRRTRSAVDGRVSWARCSWLGPNRDAGMREVPAESPPPSSTRHVVEVAGLAGQPNPVVTRAAVPDPLARQWRTRPFPSGATRLAVVPIPPSTATHASKIGKAGTKRALLERDVPALAIMGSRGRVGLVLDQLPARVGNGAPTRHCMIMSKSAACPAEKCAQAHCGTRCRPSTTVRAILTRSRQGLPHRLCGGSRVVALGDAFDQDDVALDVPRA